MAIQIQLIPLSSWKQANKQAINNQSNELKFNPLIRVNEIKIQSLIKVPGCRVVRWILEGTTPITFTHYQLTNQIGWQIRAGKLCMWRQLSHLASTNKQNTVATSRTCTNQNGKKVEMKPDFFFEHWHTCRLPLSFTPWFGLPRINLRPRSPLSNGVGWQVWHWRQVKLITFAHCPAALYRKLQKKRSHFQPKGVQRSH